MKVYSPLGWNISLSKMISGGLSGKLCGNSSLTLNEPSWYTCTAMRGKARRSKRPKGGVNDINQRWTQNLGNLSGFLRQSTVSTPSSAQVTSQIGTRWVLWGLSREDDADDAKDGDDTDDAHDTDDVDAKKRNNQAGGLHPMTTTHRIWWSNQDHLPTEEVIFVVQAYRCPIQRTSLDR